MNALMQWATIHPWLFFFAIILFGWPLFSVTVKIERKKDDDAK